ncbi:5-oxoprolinase [Bordetella genomosp. 1]|uniref:5-oxoprolinase n=1 Tax=Bordetella genomosp. 1 TaxID=1395607 RepID=A0A261STP0_9BORD|nr:hydantoinase/oxoprolinase family protein [Bordetella genomosp. 1]MDQ8033776.1 hydantoinase/oxoprolinase family protein [Bordetella sp.]OZI40230.1 5-oxoprolinase [Bordetella genomosp. 1]OZI68426.1 5-oxoprolinase [Bordetella genomosp. 1]
MYRIGIDVGGTFTDFTMIDEDNGQVHFHKVPSTPHDPSQAIQEGIANLLETHAVRADQVAHVGHGTTVATNLIIERKGAQVGLLTTRGFRDVLEIARQTRPHLYDYSVGKPPVAVPREWRIEIDERVNAAGEVLVALDEDQVRRAAEQLRDAGLQAVTVCFLHSYRNDAHERRAAEILREIMPEAYISLSSEVLPEFREYERLSTTVLNATVGPRMERYLERFLARTRELGIVHEPHTIHSNGGLMSIASVRQYPVRTCLSGPAAGVVGAAAVGRVIGSLNLVTFDVGGTSTDVSLICDGRPLFTSHRQVAGYPVKTPMVDIHVIGAGGGSIAWLDDAGGLKVGPHSAGAVPGPVGYGRGGEEPTITDAEIALQRLNPVTLLKGRMPVYAEAAREVIERRVAEPLGLSLEAAAEGILRIAAANMSRAIRAVSTERGHDLSGFALYAYGGAGPLHAVEVAEECGIPCVIVPQEPGTMCARGILLSDISFDFVRSEIAVASAAGWPEIGRLFGELEQQAQAWLDEERVEAGLRVTHAAIDARYEGQNFEVKVPLAPGDDFAAFMTRFAAEHQREYGYVVDDRRVQIINCRLQAVGQVIKAPLAPRTVGGTLAAAQLGTRRAYFGEQHGWCEAPVYDRDLLPTGAALRGPALIEEMSSTTVVAPRNHVTVDAYGNLVIRLQGDTND